MEHWTRIITAGVGPIIVISACGLLCLAFYNRLAAVVTRMRTFHREQLHEQEALAAARRGSGADSEMAEVRHQELLGMLSVQIEHVSRRARLIRRTLAALLLTIALLAACSLAVGLSAIDERFIYAAVPLFVAGLLLVIVAMIFALLELRYAFEPVDLERQFIRQLNDDLSTPGTAHASASARSAR
jgi:hypothetical protein